MSCTHLYSLSANLNSIPAINVAICLSILTIGIDIDYNRKKNWIVSQNSKSFLFTQLVVRVDPQTCKLNMVHSSI